jgi:hypothetical protein
MHMVHTRACFDTNTSADSCWVLFIGAWMMPSHYQEVFGALAVWADYRLPALLCRICVFPVPAWSASLALCACWYDFRLACFLPACLFCVLALPACML